MSLEKTLPPEHFNNVIRWIKNTDSERLAQLSVVFSAAIERLNCGRKLRLGVKGIPNGSDHFDNGSLFEWLAKVTPADAEAVRQVVMIDATIQNRIGA